MNFEIKRLNAVFSKECMHILRDPFTMLLSLLLPFLIIVILGNSIEFNMKKIATVVVDHDKTEESRKLIESFSSSDYFKIFYTDSPKHAFDTIVDEKAKAAIFIPPAFAQNIKKGAMANVQILVDGSDNSSVGAVSNYLSTIRTIAYKQLKHTDLKLPITIKERFLFNPELNSQWFAIPGLAAVIIAIVAILLTALTICKEWEQGSMELLMSTPVRSDELILGKILPYAILASMGFVIVFLSARFLFHVPFVGKYWILSLGTITFIMNYLGIGLYISVTTKQQDVAVQKALIIGMLPTALLSGFLFPIEYMPSIIQYMTLIFPPRWYIEIARNQFLQGGDFTDLWLPFTILIIQSIIIVYGAITKFRRKID